VITLVLDASTYIGTVAVLRDARLVAAAEAAMRGRREERLMPAVAGALQQAAVGPDELSRVVCGAGPGSFTSLRIAASIAKGIALAEAIPLHAVSSLALMVAGAEPFLPPGRYLAVLDALRGEAYTQLVEIVEAPDEPTGEIRPASEPGLVPLAEVEALAASLGARTVGAGRDVEAAPHARGVVRTGALLDHAGPVPLATWEPAYGRLAEAQLRWEATHGRPLAGGSTGAGGGIGG
jgi:tRNA threonylcarbamoyladenosine biosynthesis protein TsaB